MIADTILLNQAVEIPLLKDVSIVSRSILLDSGHSATIGKYRSNFSKAGADVDICMRQLSDITNVTLKRARKALLHLFLCWKIAAG